MQAFSPDGFHLWYSSQKGFVIYRPQESRWNPPRSRAEGIVDSGFATVSLACNCLEFGHEVSVPRTEETV
jgi:hypothetical protein